MAKLTIDFSDLIKKAEERNKRKLNVFAQDIEMKGSATCDIILTEEHKSLLSDLTGESLTFVENQDGTTFISVEDNIPNVEEYRKNVTELIIAACKERKIELDEKYIPSLKKEISKFINKVSDQLLNAKQKELNFPHDTYNSTFDLKYIEHQLNKWLVTKGFSCKVYKVYRDFNIEIIALDYHHIYDEFIQKCDIENDYVVEECKDQKVLKQREISSDVKTLPDDVDVEPVKKKGWFW